MLKDAVFFCYKGNRPNIKAMTHITFNLIEQGFLMKQKSKWNIYISTQTIKEFKKKCIDQGFFYSAKLEELIRGWLKEK